MAGLLGGTSAGPKARHCWNTNVLRGRGVLSCCPAGQGDALTVSWTARAPTAGRLDLKWEHEPRTSCGYQMVFGPPTLTQVRGHYVGSVLRHRVKPGPLGPGACITTSTACGKA